jgi:uridylate kinase
MGCNCGGASQGLRWILVTLADGTRKGARTEEGARLAVTIGGGGIWREVSAEQAKLLQAEGVSFR